MVEMGHDTPRDPRSKRDNETHLTSAGSAIKSSDIVRIVEDRAGKKHPSAPWRLPTSDAERTLMQSAGSRFCNELADRLHEHNREYPHVPIQLGLIAILHPLVGTTSTEVLDEDTGRRSRTLPVSAGFEIRDRKGHFIIPAGKGFDILQNPVIFVYDGIEKRADRVLSYYFSTAAFEELWGKFKEAFARNVGYSRILSDRIARHLNKLFSTPLNDYDSFEVEAVSDEHTTIATTARGRARITFTLTPEGEIQSEATLLSPVRGTTTVSALQPYLNWGRDQTSFCIPANSNERRVATVIITQWREWIGANVLADILKESPDTGVRVNSKLQVRFEFPRITFDRCDAFRITAFGTIQRGTEYYAMLSDQSARIAEPFLAPLSHIFISSAPDDAGPFEFLTIFSPEAFAEARNRLVHFFETIQNSALFDTKHPLSTVLAAPALKALRTHADLANEELVLDTVESNASVMEPIRLRTKAGSKISLICTRDEGLSIACFSVQID